MWENTTSYTQGEEKSEIRTTSINVDGLKLTVTKYSGYGNHLVMHCHTLGISTKYLDETDMEKAQLKAIEIVKAKAKKILYAIEQI
tara:strand:+ start:864 stop:1121 length:258 start_codon:yes stop_codon:yes gene_type:complete